MEQTVAEKLATIVARPVPGATVERVCSHLLDWIACAALGATAPVARGFIADGRLGRDGPSVTFGAGRRAEETAAFVNGALGNIFEMDDIHRTSIVHAGDVVIPAALAVAEVSGASGKQLLGAIAAGYEAAIRLGIAAGADHYARWYNTATCGVFGAAVAAGRILGLDAEGLARALALAGMQTSGLWQCRLEPGGGKQLATAHAAAAGLRAARLAASGVEGPRAILEGPLGFFAAMAPAGDPWTVVEGAAGEWLLADVSFKPWPACRHAHPVIEAALHLRQEAEGAELSSALVETYAPAIAFCDDPAPDTPHRGRFSLQHAFAVAWHGGAPTLAEFEPDALSDPAIVALRGRVSVAADDGFSAKFPAAYGARLTVDIRGRGTRVHEVATAKGDPENPMSASELAAKAEALLLAAGLSVQQIDRLATAVRDLPAAADPIRLSEALMPLTMISNRNEADHAAQ